MPKKKKTKKGLAWAASFSYRDESGKRQYKQLGVFSTEAEARALEEKTRAEYEAAEKQAAAVTTFGPKTLGEWARKWADTTLRINTRPSGYDTAEGRIRNHVPLPQTKVALT